MITTGIIREVAVNKGNFIGNAYKVELNIFQIPGDNDKKNYTYTANCAVPGGVYDSFNVGDKVFVGFLNNNKSLPLILGKIYQGVKDEARSIANLNALKVKSKAELPKNTTIGNIDFSDKEYFFDNVNEVIQDKDIFVDSIQLKTDNEGAGRITFDNFEGVAQISLSPNVTMALGVDTVLKVYNDTNDTLVDGTVVYRSGNINDTTKVQPAIANNHTISNNTIGVITEPIASNDYGFISRQGYVGGLLLDPAVYATDQILYLSPSVPGTFTNQKPVAPNFITQIGYVYKVSSDASTYDGQIYVDIIIIPISSDISYNNANTHLDSQTVKGAIDELSLKKADISMLTSEAIDIITDTTQFNTILSSDDTNVQHALNTLDRHTHALPVASDTVLGAIKIGDGLNVELDGTVSVDTLAANGVKITVSDSESPPPLETLEDGDFWYEY